MIVNEAFVREFGIGANPLGKRIWQKPVLGEPQVVYEIVGLVKNTKYQDLREDYPPLIYVPMSQLDDCRGGCVDSDTILIRSSAPFADLTPRVKQTIARVNPDISIQFKTMQGMIHDELVGERLMATLSGFFGVLAGLLATLGLYGVMSYMVVRRTNEIGIRMTLGASRAEITGMVIREAAILLAVGLGVGVLLALAGAKAASSMLFGLKPYDPATLAIAAALLALVALGASYVPARRATKVDPMVALRYE